MTAAAGKPMTTAAITITVDAAALTWVRALAAARQQRKQAEDAERRARVRVEALFGDADSLADEDGGEVARRVVTERRTVDVKALREKDPDLADAFTVTTEVVRIDLHLADQ